MHIFLTGEIQVGKSSVIKKTLSLLNFSCGGFKTYFNNNERYLSNRVLYMNSYSEAKVFNEENIVAQLNEGSPPLVDHTKFNVYACELIKTALVKSDLVLMDECGSLERNALEFHREVINALNGNKPILGVVRQGNAGWTNNIRKHPNVKLITVTKENRDFLPEILIDRYLKL